MLIRAAELRGIRDGKVDLAFRRWTTARVRQGTRLRTQIGLVEVTSVDQTTIEAIDPRQARRAGAASLEELLSFLDHHPQRRVFRIGVRYAGPDPRVALREDEELSDDDRMQITAKLERLDGASRHGPWTNDVLEIIGRRPATRAGDLAAELGTEKRILKRDVRKLKELGLTESLDTGYRLSPRGRAFIIADSGRAAGA